MSLYDYTVSKALHDQDAPFYALIMAAMRQADSRNLSLLQAVFPDTWIELQARYNAPGGAMEADQ